MSVIPPSLLTYRWHCTWNLIHIQCWAVSMNKFHICANFFWDISVRFLSWECWIISEDSWRSLKSSEEVRSLLKTSEICRMRSYRENTYPQNQRSRGRYCYLFIYTWFSFLTWVWVNIFLEIVSSKMATTHIFQSGVRNWPASVSRREIEVFNPQAWESRLRRESVRVGRHSFIHLMFCIDTAALKVTLVLSWI